MDRAKDSRARMIRAFDQRTYVHPAARFALSEEEQAAEAERARLTVEEEPNDEPGTDESDGHQEPLDEAA